MQAGAAELQLEALPFADLQRRIAEALDELGRGQADERRRAAGAWGGTATGPAAAAGRGCDVRRRRAAGDEQGGDEGDAAHAAV